MAWFKNKAGTKAPASSPVHRASRGGQPDVEALVERCRRRSVSALVIEPKSLVAHRGQLESVDDDRLTVWLDGTGPPNALKPTSSCFVTFADVSRAGTFSTRVIALRKKPDGFELEIDVPARLILAETRQRFRVTVPKGSGLVSVLHTSDGLPRRCACLDLSFAGARVSVAREVAALLSEGTILDLELTLPGHHVRVPAEVLRSQENDVGLRFPTAEEGGDLAPPRDLLRLVRDLERGWLQQKGKR